jgi:hypothetical protein
LKRDPFASSIEGLNRQVGCVTHARLGVLSRGRGGLDALVGFRVVAAVRVADPLRSAALTVRLFLRAHDRGAGNDVRTAGYDYALLDRDGVELLAYHWHPGETVRGPDVPHLHVSAALRPNRSSRTPVILPLDKRHLVTGPVTLAGFLAMLVAEFGVVPLVTDWQRLLGT